MRAVRDELNTNLAWQLDYRGFRKEILHIHLENLPSKVFSQSSSVNLSIYLFNYWLVLARVNLNIQLLCFVCMESTTAKKEHREENTQKKKENLYLKNKTKIIKPACWGEKNIYFAFTTAAKITVYL